MHLCQLRSMSQKTSGVFCDQVWGDPVGDKGYWDLQRWMLLRTLYSNFFAVGGSSSRRYSLWCLVWDAGTQSTSRLGILRSDTHRTTTEPVSWGTNTLAVKVVLCPGCRDIQIFHGTKVLVSWACHSDWGWGTDAVAKEALGWHGTAVAWA